MQEHVLSANPALGYEPWQTVCVIAVSGSQSIQLELWDANGRNVPVNNGGTEYSSVNLTVAGTAYSLPYLLQNASYTTNTTVVPGTATGVPNPKTDGNATSAVGGQFLNTGTLGIACNTGGTVDGSAGAGNGIDGSAGRAPVVGGPFIVQPGQICKFGQFLSDPN